MKFSCGNKEFIVNQESSTVLVNGRLNTDFSPAYADNLDGTVTLLGVVDNKTSKFYSISGKELKVTGEDNIKI